MDLEGWRAFTTKLRLSQCLKAHYLCMCALEFEKKNLFFYNLCLSYQQSELERIEDEQTLEELQILRETVYVSFRKHEEIAEAS